MISLNWGDMIFFLTIPGKGEIRWKLFFIGLGKNLRLLKSDVDIVCEDAFSYFWLSPESFHRLLFAASSLTS